MLISSLDTQPLYESCWLRRKCHQLSGMQQHIAQTYVPAKPETCYCMCEGAVINTGREMLWVLQWTPTMCLCAFYSAVGLRDYASVSPVEKGHRHDWNANRVGLLAPWGFPFPLKPFSSLKSDSFTLKRHRCLEVWEEEASDTSFRCILVGRSLFPEW